MRMLSSPGRLSQSLCKGPMPCHCAFPPGSGFLALPNASRLLDTAGVHLVPPANASTEDVFSDPCLHSGVLFAPGPVPSSSLVERSMVLLQRGLQKGEGSRCEGALRILSPLPGISLVRPKTRRQDNAEAPGTARPHQVQNPFSKVGAEQIVLSRILKAPSGLSPCTPKPPSRNL